MIKKWDKIRGVDGNTYYNYFLCVFENSDLAAQNNIDNAHKHSLLCLLDQLGIVQYVQDYPGVWEIVMKARTR